MRLAILGSNESPYVRWLLQAAENAPAVRQAQCLGFSELAAFQQGAEQWTSISDFDAVLVRTMPLGSLEQVIFRMDCLQLLQDSGKVVINGPRTLEVSIDKWLTLHRLRAAGIPTPNTIACQTRDEAMTAFQALGGDCVVKPLFGGEGRGLLRVQNEDMAWRTFSTLQQLRSVMYVQQFEAHLGYDIRVLFVGDQHFAMRRVAQAGSWRTNVSQGSQGEAIELTDSQRSLAAQAAAAVAGNERPSAVLGVDLLPCNDGRLLVLEVNAVPGWRALQRVVGIDISDQIIDLVSTTLTR